MKKIRNWTFIAFAFVCIAWLATWQLVGVVEPQFVNGEITFNNANDDGGTFGDKFGFINSLFSGLAFVGLIAAILLQQEELKNTQEIMKDQKEEFKTQNNSIKLQNFEGTFFQLLRNFNDIIDGVDIKTGNENHTGRDGIYMIFQRLAGIARKRGAQWSWKEIYEEFYKSNSHEIAHYFRILYRLFRYIEEKALEGDGEFYAKIVRAQLSRYETILLFYNVLSPHGEKFKTQVNKYQLLKFVNPDDLINAKDVLEHNPTAFGNDVAAVFYKQQKEKN
jgi:hypothetical protein